MRRRHQGVLGIIMAGGKGERLMPLTEFRSKPAVPFAGKYRIIDFVLSNFVNSGIIPTSPRSSPTRNAGTGETSGPLRPTGRPTWTSWVSALSSTFATANGRS